MSESCLFCRIVAGEVPADVVLRTDSVLAFRDLDPKAPLHVLVISVRHHPDVAAAARDGGDVLVEMGRLAAQVAQDEAPDGWRWVFNTGPAGGQSVQHVHGHVLGGRQMTWPPG